MGKAAIYDPYLDTLGGGERYSLTFAKAVNELFGFEVDLFWKDQDILSQINNRFGNLLKNVKVNIVTDIKRGDGYDLCFWVSDGSIPMLRARRNYLHFQVPFQDVDGSSLLNKMKLFRIDSVISNSEFTKRIIDREYGISSKVIYPPVDLIHASKRKSKTIIYVGRFSNLIQSKGHHLLIEAFSKFVEDKDFKDWKLILAGSNDVGDNGYLAKLKEKANGLNVEFLINPDYKTLTGVYSKASIFWSAAGFGINPEIEPHKMEHFGITVVEAMSAGVVPLVYKGGGHLETVDGSFGYLWETESQLIDQTKILILDRQKMNQFSRLAIQSSLQYDYSSFKEKIKDIVRVG